MLEIPALSSPSDFFGGSSEGLLFNTRRFSLGSEEEEEDELLEFADAGRFPAGLVAAGLAGRWDAGRVTVNVTSWKVIEPRFRILAATDSNRHDQLITY